MNKIGVSAILLMTALSAIGNELVRGALNSVMSSNFTANSDEELVAEECGLPQSLFRSPSFTNLVAVVRSEIDNCPMSFVCEMTNRVPRDVFVAALIRCGQTTYRNAITNWFGGATAPSVSPELMEEFVVPTRTCMEGYFIDHYNETGISNVWLNIKSRYVAVGETDEAAGIDNVLNGKCKAERELLRRLEHR